MKSTQVFLSNLVVLNIQLHNLHWNTRDIQFVPVHNFTEALYDEVFKYYDDVAELIKISGDQPLTTMRAYLDNATIAELEHEIFTAKEALSIIRNYLVDMVDLATAVIYDEDNFQVTNLMEDIITSFEKHIWFIGQMGL